MRAILAEIAWLYAEPYAGVYSQAAYRVGATAVIAAASGSTLMMMGVG